MPGKSLNKNQGKLGGSKVSPTKPTNLSLARARTQATPNVGPGASKNTLDKGITEETSHGATSSIDEAAIGNKV